MNRYGSFRKYNQAGIRMDRNHTGKRIGVLLLFILIAGAIYFWEENHVRLLFAGISPFPEDDYWNTLVNALLRDVLLLIAAGLLFLRRKRIPDRVLCAGNGYRTGCSAISQR